MNIPSFFSSLQSDRYAHLLRYGAFALIGLILFGAGIFVGHRAADFAYRWDAGYARQFTGAQSPFSFDADDDRPSMPHGAFGQIIGMNFPSLAIKGAHEVEKIVLIGTTTAIRSFHGQTSTSSLVVGSNVVVIGEPDGEGRISATLIRIIPQAPMPIDATTSQKR